jgi:hypothetical protein
MPNVEHRCLEPRLLALAVLGCVFILETYLYHFVVAFE